MALAHRRAYVNTVFHLLTWERTNSCHELARKQLALSDMMTSWAPKLWMISLCTNLMTIATGALGDAFAIGHPVRCSTATNTYFCLLGGTGRGPAKYRGNIPKRFLKRRLIRGNRSKLFTFMTTPGVSVYGFDHIGPPIPVRDELHGCPILVPNEVVKSS